MITAGSGTIPQKSPLMGMVVQGLKEFRGTCPPISSQIEVEWWGAHGTRLPIIQGHKSSNGYVGGTHLPINPQHEIGVDGTQRYRVFT